MSRLKHKASSIQKYETYTINWFLQELGVKLKVIAH